ncbi:hypothetical protein [Cupriavidus sp. TMH.W2]|uniref:hypothetical protein n=1 Tax=Cupriavidus sp. TMH.W2 TaxID=3434465 RepID=UPI003D77F91E
MHPENHFVIIYTLPTGASHFAEIAGRCAFRFGPFGTKATSLQMASVLFPQLRVIDLSVQGHELDEVELLILANAQFMSELSAAA